MLTDKDRAQMQVIAYSPAPAGFANAWNIDGVLVFRYIEHNNPDNPVFDTATHHVIFPGSMTDNDWSIDFSFLKYDDPVIGPVHLGFNINMAEVYRLIAPVLGPRVKIQGHSLGAARAQNFAARLCADNKPPVDCVTWGTPRVGMAEFCKLIVSGNFPVRMYANGIDPVCEVPVPLPDAPFAHPGNQIRLHVPPPLDHVLSPGAWHSMSLYAKGTPNQ
jgi:pimeloyl-ACP methyl ester carboxylesterase